MVEINTLQELIDTGKVIGLDALQDRKTNLLKDIQTRLKQIGLYTDSTEVPGVPTPGEDGDRFNGSLKDLLAFISATRIA